MEETQPSAALGGLSTGVSTRQMAAAYVPFGNGGTYYEPITYTKLYDKDGNVIIDKSEEKGTQVYMQKTTSSVMTSLLTSVVTGGTGVTAQVYNAEGTAIPTAGKTGTTSDVKDYWFVGYTPYYTCAVWYGYDNQTVISGSEAGAAIKMWSKVMNRIHENLETKEFETHDEFVTKSVCSVSGKLPTSQCYNDPRYPITEEIFAVGTEPTEYCDIHTTKNVCTAHRDRYGKYYLATSSCSSVTSKSGTFRPILTFSYSYLDTSIIPQDWSYELSHLYCPYCGG